MKPTLASRRDRIARVQAKRPPDAVRIAYANDGEPDIETAVDRWVRSLLDSPPATGERRKP